MTDMQLWLMPEVMAITLLLKDTPYKTNSQPQAAGAWTVSVIPPLLHRQTQLLSVLTPPSAGLSEH